MELRHRPARAVGYVRVSTRRQQRDGESVPAQRRAIHEEVRRRRWEEYAVEEEARSGGRGTDRPVLERLLGYVEAGEADVLVVAKLDRLARSTVDFGLILERVEAAGGAVVVLDMGLDLTTDQGELMATVLMAFAQWERKLIRRRVREAFDEQRAAQGSTNHKRMDPRLRARIRRMRTAGKTTQQIADLLDREGVPTVRGGKGWDATTVRRAIA